MTQPQHLPLPHTPPPSQSTFPSTTQWHRSTSVAKEQLWLHDAACSQPVKSTGWTDLCECDELTAETGQHALIRHLLLYQLYTIKCCKYTRIFSVLAVVQPNNVTFTSLKQEAPMSQADRPCDASCHSIDFTMERHSRSLKIAPFGRLHRSSYRRCTCSISGTKRDIGQKYSPCIQHPS